MNDTHDLLMQDAERVHSSSVRALDLNAMIDRAVGQARHRRVRLARIVGAAAIVTIAGGAGAATFAGHGHAAPRPVKLAAYDVVLGSVPHADGHRYVLGPDDAFTKSCTVVPDAPVTVDSARGSISVRLPDSFPTTNVGHGITQTAWVGLDRRSDILASLHEPIHLFDCATAAH